MYPPDHPAFSPPAQNSKLWRYMDFSKFVSFLETEKLRFARADQFDDPFEGTLSGAEVRRLRSSATNLNPEHYVEKMIHNFSNQQKEMFISCWYADESESAAMWKLYLKSNEGVAICTDYDTLRGILDKTTFEVGISMVRYIDFETTSTPSDNGFFPFVHKRISFAHEKELRAVIWRQDFRNEPLIPVGSTSVDVDATPSQLVKSIYVSPTAPSWLGELIEQVMRRYSLKATLQHSSLYDRPIY